MPVAYDLSGKTAVVTGGAKGIGEAIAEKLSNSNAKVHVWDLNAGKLNSVTYTKVDVTSPDEIKLAVDNLVTQNTRVDILVNDAGYLGPAMKFEARDPSDWQRISG